MWVSLTNIHQYCFWHMYIFFFTISNTPSFFMCFCIGFVCSCRYKCVGTFKCVAYSAVSESRGQRAISDILAQTLPPAGFLRQWFSLYLCCNLIYCAVTKHPDQRQLCLEGDYFSIQMLATNAGKSCGQTLKTASHISSTVKRSVSRNAWLFCA